MRLKIDTLAFMRIPGTWGAGLSARIEKEAGPEAVVRFDPPRDVTRFDLGASAKVLVGRFGCGHHLKLGLPGARYVTFVRQPLARLIAQYREELAVARAPRDGAEAPSLVTHIRAAQAAAWRFDNTIVRMVSGVMDEVPRGALGPDILERAISNAERHCWFIGEMEHFRGDLALLETRLRWPPSGSDLGEGGAAGAHLLLSPEERDLAHELTRLDAPFCEYVRRFWSEGGAAFAAGPARWMRWLRVRAFRRGLHALEPAHTHA